MAVIIFLISKKRGKKKTGLGNKVTVPNIQTCDIMGWRAEREGDRKSRQHRGDKKSDRGLDLVLISILLTSVAVS